MMDEHGALLGLQFSSFLPTAVASALGGADLMKISFPNSADLRNITHFLKSIDTSDPSTLEFNTHPRWAFVHPAVLALTACAAALVISKNGNFSGTVYTAPSINYPARMGLFNLIKLNPPIVITEHEESGRFIPLPQIRDSKELKNSIANLVPLLHAPKEVSDPIRYVFSEMVRNTLEHSGSPVGAFVAAQYYSKSRRIAIGIADAGIGVFEHMRRFHHVADAKDAITLALQPGITGTTSRIGGTATNAGAGLFFTKSIASFSKNMFLLYSGDAAYWPAPGSEDTELGVFMGPEVRHGEAKVYARIQA